MLGLFPTSYIWSYRCLDVSVVLGNWLSKNSFNRKYERTHDLVRASFRQPARRHGILQSGIVKSWASVWVCFCVQVNDLSRACRRRTTGNIICDVAPSLNNVLLLSVVLVLLTPSKGGRLRSNRNGSTNITTQLWTDVRRCSDPNGCLRAGAARGTRAWKPELNRGSEQSFVIWHVVEFLTKHS